MLAACKRAPSARKSAQLPEMLPSQQKYLFFRIPVVNGFFDVLPPGYDLHGENYIL
jgi:hypothetical protein